jgi:hypothetical protein
MFLKTFKTRPELAEQVGFHVHPRDFATPFVVLEEIDQGKLTEPRLLPDIDLRVPAALELMALLQHFAPELDAFPYDRDGDSSFWFNNGSFTDFDAAVLYALLRHLKPKRYIEVGCGYSSLISSRALQRNQRDGAACDAVYVDPEPRLELSKALAYGRLNIARVQDLPLETFAGLRPGDVLFIDTSHALKIQGDVEQQLLRILPSLVRGVWIHFHDVFTPYDYPEDWVLKPVRMSVNEQYAVECLLSGGARYQVEIPLHYLVRHHLREVQHLLPRGRVRAQSFWMRKAP